MKLIVLYGPPAVGKLTVGRELSALTGYKLFHNHLTVDFLDPIIGYGTRRFFQLLSAIRLLIFEHAARINLPGLIFTFVYAKSHDDAFVNQMIRVVESHSGEVLFVRLTCVKDELAKRVADISRREFDKIRTPEALEKNLAEADLVSAIPERESLTLNTTRLSPHAVAEQIIETLHLPRVEKKKPAAASEG